MEILKAFKFRIYPTEEQEADLRIQFGHARFVYNRFIDTRKTTFLTTGKGVSFYDFKKQVTAMKQQPDFVWLKDGDSQVLQASLEDADRAFQNFFRNHKNGTLPPPGKKPRKDGMPKGYPTFWSKHDDQSIRYPQRFKLEGRKIYLPKVGWVSVVQHRRAPASGREGKMKSCTVSKTKTGKFFVSIQCEVDHAVPEQNPNKVGIDLGLTTFVTFSDGQKIEKPKHFKASERRLKIRQRRLSRKVKGSNSRGEARWVVASIHEKIANQRKDFHHKLSRTVVDNFGTIAFESLNIGGMMKNHNLAKAIADAGWNQFVGFVEYKATWDGSQVSQVERFFPSSKLCSDCGEKHKSLSLSTRSWVCLNCGVIHDRDENAAINILKQATGGAPESYAAGYMSVLVQPSAPEKFKAFALDAQVL